MTSSLGEFGRSCLRHPWRVFWCNVAAFWAWMFLVGYADSPPHRLLDVLSPVFAWAIMAIGCASFGLGLWTSFRRSLVSFGLVLLLLALTIMSVLVYARVMNRVRSVAPRAEADVHALASAVSMYSKHTGRLPASLADLTAPSTNAKGETAGPFIGVIPTPPSGWTPSYTYAFSADGTFAISATGDGMTVRAP